MRDAVEILLLFFVRSAYLMTRVENLTTVGTTSFDELGIY